MKFVGLIGQNSQPALVFITLNCIRLGQNTYISPAIEASFTYCTVPKRVDLSSNCTCRLIIDVI
jgi:hypothetical protein